MTITEILLNFRAALLAVIPAMERVQLAWRSPDAYDEWDDVANALFGTLVTYVLFWSLPEPDVEWFSLAPYDLLLPTYANVSTIEVTHPGLAGGWYLFRRFDTDQAPFDQLRVREVSTAGVPLREDVLCPIDGAAFRLRVFRAGVSSQLIDEVVVQA